MKQLFLLLVISIMVMGLVSAENQQIFTPNKDSTILHVCEDNGITCSATTLCNISIYYPNSSIFINNEATTRVGDGEYNYVIKSHLLGRYNYKIICKDGSIKSNPAVDYFDIAIQGDEQDRGLTEFSIFLIIALIISLFCFRYVSRLLGSLAIFIIGFGILFRNPINGWIGWIIVGIGFLMLIYTIMDDRKKRRF